MFLSAKFLSEFRGMFTHIPRISRDELDQHYNQASALVFNPVADGFGHVILEAMSHGVPVIASRNCGAPDVVEHESEGLLVDYGSDEQLSSAIDWALSHPNELSQMGNRARMKAESWKWSDYAIEFMKWLRRCV
jgi:glycosyltransferase involved in cell wall biosynthesis